MDKHLIIYYPPGETILTKEEAEIIGVKWIDEYTGIPNREIARAALEKLDSPLRVKLPLPNTFKLQEIDAPSIKRIDDD